MSVYPKPTSFKSIHWLVFILTVLMAITPGRLSADGSLNPEAVKALTEKVADWQLRTFPEHGLYRAPNKWYNQRNYHDLIWQMGSLYAGINEWRKVSDNPDRYTDFLKMIGDRTGWKPGKRKYHSDDHVVGHAFLAMYEEFKDPAMLKPFQERFDWILQNPKTGSLKMGDDTDWDHRWGWCDALFMGPPVWARMAKVTGDSKYLDFMDQEYHASYDLLWDKEEHLFWRDSSFFPEREKNGRKVFWARGNGWVFAGLALMIPDLPEDWEGRAFYLNLFREMADSIKDCQREDGTWSMGLLGDPQHYPVKESSGTSFCTFGLAWGVNNDLLDRETYEPIVAKAWKALEGCVADDGLLGYVQPVGSAPGYSFPDKSEVFGVGAFLAAGAEVYKLAGSQAVAGPES